MTAKQYLKKYQSILITLIIIIVPLICISYMFLVNKTYGGTDDTFHWQRFMELRYDLTHGILPQFQTHASNPLGNAINIFYPYEILVPYIYLTMFIKQPMNLIYTIYLLIWITCSVTSYFCSKSYFKSKKSGLIFSILYTASSTLSNTLLVNDDVGEAFGYAWLPLILFGALWILRNNSHWLMLSIGVTCLIYSHILTTILAIITITIIFLLNINIVFRHISIIFSLIKATIVTTLSTALMWMPLIYTILTTNYFNPRYDFGHKFEMSGLLISQTGTYLHENCGFIDGIGILVGLFGIFMLIFHNHLSFKIPYKDWTIWIIGMIFWLSNTDIPIIHHAFAYSPASVLQYSFRSCMIIHIYLTYIAVKWLLGYYNYGKIHYKRVFIGLSIAFAVLLQIGNQMNDKLIYQQRLTYTSSRQCRFGLQLGELEKHHHQGFGYIISNKSFKHMRNTAIVDDYSPYNTTEQKDPTAYILRDNFNAIINGNPNNTRKVLVTKKGVRIDLNKNERNITIPIMYYNKYKYDLTDNNHLTKWGSSNHTNFVNVKHLSKGKHIIQIHPKINSNTKYALILSDLGLILLLGSIDKYFIQKIISRKRE